MPPLELDPELDVNAVVDVDAVVAPPLPPAAPVAPELVVDAPPPPPGPVAVVVCAAFFPAQAASVSRAHRTRAPLPIVPREIVALGTRRMGFSGEGWR
jgi:hypothetical protein